MIAVTRHTERARPAAAGPDCARGRFGQRRRIGAHLRPRKEASSRMLDSSGDLWVNRGIIDRTFLRPFSGMGLHGIA